MLIALASVGMAILNTLNHFFIPALAPALFNVALILAGIFLAPQFEKWGILPIHAMGVGALVGGLLQYGLQLPLMRQHGYRFRFRIDLAHEGVRKIALLMAPAIVGVSAVQINVLVNTQIASFLQENGPVSWLSYAFRIVYLLAAGFADVPGKVEITADLLKILSPFLMLIALASVGMAILNTLNHFFIPALAPALFNVALIAAGIFLAPQFEKWGILPIHAMGVGALVGGLLQYGLQLPLMRQHGYRFCFRIDLGHEGVQKIARLMAPAIVGVSAVQINVLVNTQIASFLQENGPVSWLSYAFRIIYLPIGLFGVAVGVVNLRDVSLLAAQEKWEELKETVANSIKLISILAIPSAVGLMVLAVPIVRVLFERGGFTSADTLYTAYAVIFYSLGLFAYSCIKVYVPTFYALNDTRTPVRISMMAVVGNLSCNLILVFFILPEEYAYVGLAFGTALSVTLSSIWLARSLQRKLGSLQDYRVIPTFLKTVAASIVMGAVVYFLNQFFAGFWMETNLWRELVALTSCILVGIAVYFGCCLLLRIEETHRLFRRLKR